MATAFMGYVLPFGQMSFWGATVITNLLSPFPSFSSLENLLFYNLSSGVYVIILLDLSFVILFMWKLHQIHFVFLLIILGY